MLTQRPGHDHPGAIAPAHDLDTGAQGFDAGVAGSGTCHPAICPGTGTARLAEIHRAGYDPGA